VRHQQTIDDCLRNSIRSLADIVRTPLFGLASLVTSIAILLASPFNSELLLSGRRLLGKIEVLANWGVKKSPWTLGFCFQPLDLSFLNTYEGRQEEKDTLYSSDDPLEKQLTHFARSAIHYRQTHIDITTCQKESMDEAYNSLIDIV